MDEEGNRRMEEGKRWMCSSDAERFKGVDSARMYSYSAVCSCLRDRPRGWAAKDDRGLQRRLLVQMGRYWVINLCGGW